jgi:GxxExxY protein
MVVINEITERIIRAAMAVHSVLGPGLLEKAYDVCLFYELSREGLQFEHQLKLPVTYREIRLEAGFRVDYLVENCVLVELKAVDRLLPVHSAQLLSYLKLTGRPIGLLINFNVVHLRDGIRRVANGYDPNQLIDPLRPLRPLR